MLITQKYLDELTYKIIGCAIEVQKQLGPGLLESVYEKCFVRELGLRDLQYQSQQKVPVIYKDIHFDAELRFDVLVENLIDLLRKSNKIATKTPKHKITRKVFVIL